MGPQTAGQPYRRCSCRGRYDSHAIAHFTVMMAPTPTMAARSSETG